MSYANVDGTSRTGYAIPDTGTYYDVDQAETITFDSFDEERGVAYISGYDSQVGTWVQEEDLAEFCGKVDLGILLLADGEVERNNPIFPTVP